MTIPAKSFIIINITSNINSDNIIGVSLLKNNPIEIDGYIAAIATPSNWIMLFNAFNFEKNIAYINFRIFYIET